MIRDMIARFGPETQSVVDIGGGYGIFAEEYQKIGDCSVIVVEPGPDLADVCRSRGLSVVSKFLEDIEISDIGEGPHSFVSFELFEHLVEPESFVQHLSELMKSGDLFIFSTLSGTGLDIQVLWENSKSVTPPHHLNFFNPRCTRYFLESMDLEVLEITTPGKLDVDIMNNSKTEISDRFWNTFLDHATENERANMQTFISEAGYSSHMWAVCRKP